MVNIDLRMACLSKRPLPAPVATGSCRRCEPWLRQVKKLAQASADGSSFEVGYARAIGKPILGYRTGLRVGEADGVNAMLRYGCFLIADRAYELAAPSTKKIMSMTFARVYLRWVFPFVAKSSVG